MLVVISPAKTIKFPERTLSKYTNPVFLQEANYLVSRLKQFTVGDIKTIMQVSESIARLNVERYHSWHEQSSEKSDKQALLAFQGMVFIGLEAASLSDKELYYAQDTLRILSGLYGVLCPLDLIQAYRLEMGTKIAIDHHKNLYQYWGNKITDNLNKTFESGGHKFLINLASNEYFKSINLKRLNAEVITPVFKENRNGDYKVITVYAKKARGLMTRFIIKNKIKEVEQLKAFDAEGYYFNVHLSEGNNWVFTREY